MNSYYPASFFAQYSTDNIPHNVGYNSNNFGLLSRFADQISAYHSNNFNSDHHHRFSNGFSSHHSHQDTHFQSRENSSSESPAGGGGAGRISNYPQPAPAHQPEENNLPRSYSSCSTENWSPPPHGVQPGSPDSLHPSTSPYSPVENNNNNPCNMMLHKNMKSDQNSAEQPTPFYPWMGIVGKCTSLSYFLVLKQFILTEYRTLTLWFNAMPRCVKRTR